MEKLQSFPSPQHFEQFDGSFFVVFSCKSIFPVDVVYDGTRSKTSPLLQPFCATSSSIVVSLDACLQEGLEFCLWTFFEKISLLVPRLECILQWLKTVPILSLSHHSGIIASAADLDASNEE